MNFVYISPNFPAVMQNFCAALHGNGVNVLGIGDAPYDALSDMLKAALTEYYRVDSLERYDDVLRAVGYFTFKYGKIDWLESNNEYWLAQDARLRTDFNITTGLKTPELDPYKYKSCMKAVFQKAGIPAARWQLAAALEDALRFAAEVGYPIIIKPDNGVGASDTRKIADENALRAFFAAPGPARYIMEEYVPGEVTTYDGLCNSRGEVLFAASHITPSSIMDMVNNADDCFYYVNQPAAKDVCRAGQAVLAALGAKSRCFHLEFFRLTEDKPGLGKRGSLAAWRSICAPPAASRRTCSITPIPPASIRCMPTWWSTTVCATPTTAPVLSAPTSGGGTASGISTPTARSSPNTGRSCAWPAGCPTPCPTPWETRSTSPASPPSGS